MPTNQEVTRGLASVIAISAITSLLVLAAALVGLKVSPTPPSPTIADEASLLCSTQAPFMNLTGEAATDGELPDVGAPKAILAVPACLQSAGESSYYTREIVVYVMVSSEQLNGLHFIVTDPKHDTPYLLDRQALKHLVTPQQRAEIETGIDQLNVSYFVTDGPLPTDEQSGQAPAAHDLLSGRRYDLSKLPFLQHRAAHDLGPVIVVRGSK